MPMILSTQMQGLHTATVIPMDAWYIKRAADLDLEELAEAYQAIAPVCEDDQRQEPERVQWWPEAA